MSTVPVGRPELLGPPPAASPDEVDDGLQPQRSVLKGRVHGLVDGVVIEVSVAAVAPVEAWLGAVETAEDGRFELEVPEALEDADQLQLWVASNHASYAPLSAKLLWDRRGQDGDIEVEVVSEPAIVGRIVCEGGGDAQLCCIGAESRSLFDEHMAQWSMAGGWDAPPQRDGNFRRWVEPGESVLMIMGRSVLPVGMYLDVPGGVRDVGTIVLRQAVGVSGVVSVPTGTAKGTLTLTPASAGGVVRAWSSAGDCKAVWDGARALAGPVTTGVSEDGEFAVSGVGPGPYHCWLKTDGGLFATPEPVTVFGSDTSIDLRMERAGEVCIGAYDGKGLVVPQVSVRSASGHVLGGRLIRPVSSIPWTLDPPLALGEYHLQLELPGYETATRDVTLDSVVVTVSIEMVKSQ